jgi:hypothetical protein
LTDFVSLVVGAERDVLGQHREVVRDDCLVLVSSVQASAIRTVKLSAASLLKVDSAAARCSNVSSRAHSLIERAEVPVMVHSLIANRPGPAPPACRGFIANSRNDQGRVDIEHQQRSPSRIDRTRRTRVRPVVAWRLSAPPAWPD